MVVNASGAWAGKIAHTGGVEVNVQAGKGTMVALSYRVINTVVNRCKMPSDGDIIVPIHTVSVIGTTDEGVPDPEHFAIEPWEVKLMLEEADKLVPGFSEMRMLRAWAGFAWARPLLRALYARYPFSHALPPFILQTCINAVRGVSKGLEHALTDDPTGMAEYHLIGAMELLIKLELSLEEYEVCMKRCHVNVFTDSNMKRVRSSGGRLSPPSGAAVYDVKSLQIEVGTAIDTLVRSFRDVLSRPDCPLLQDDSTAPVLLARIKSIH